ncbi:hypothetical protein ACJJTC_006521 [Scirpophaga incertulas]
MTREINQMIKNQVLEEADITPSYLSTFFLIPKPDGSFRQRLDGKVGFKPSLLSSANSPTAPQISEGELQRQTLPDDMSTFWPICGTRNFRFSHQLDSGIPQKPQDPLCGVLGRFPTGKSVLRAVERTSQYYNQFTSTPGLDYEFSEICSHSDTTPRVSRCYLEHTKQLQVPVGIKVQNAPQCTTRTQRQLVPQTGPVPNGETKLCLFRRPERKASLSDAAIPQPTVAEIQTPQEIHDSRTSPSRNELVGKDGFQFNTSSYESHHTSTYYRRIRNRMGSTTWADNFIRSVDDGTTELACQLQRTVCGLSSSSTRAATSEERPRTPSDRQSYCRSLHKQGGRHEVQETFKTDKTVVGPARLSKHKFDGSVLPRAIQYRSRCIVTQEDEPRMALVTPGDDSPVSAVGDTGGRSICFEDCSRGPTIRSDRPTRRGSIISQRISPSLGLQPRLLFPPPNLMPQVLCHLNMARGTFILIAPRWEKVFWLVDLQQRSIRKPLQIQNLPHVLIDTKTERHPPEVHNMILDAWLIRGGRI